MLGPYHENVGLVSEWRRKTMGAVSASLLLPALLLLAAAAVASGGNLGGLGSLGQVASGPSLPETGAPAREETSLADAGVVGADVPAAEARAARAATTSGGGGGSVALAQAPSIPTPTAAVPQVSSPGAPPVTPPAGGTPTSPGAVPTPTVPVESAPADGGAPPNLVENVVDTTRGVVAGIPVVGPVADSLLNILLGTPQ